MQNPTPNLVVGCVHFDKFKSNNSIKRHKRLHIILRSNSKSQDSCAYFFVNFLSAVKSATRYKYHGIFSLGSRCNDPTVIGRLFYVPRCGGNRSW